MRKSNIYVIKWCIELSCHAPWKNDRIWLQKIWVCLQPKDFSRLNFYRKPHFWANTSVMPEIEVSQWLKNTLQIRKVPQDRVPCLSRPVIDVVRAHWPWDKFHQVHLFCAHDAPMWGVVALATDSIQIRVTFYNFIRF